MSRAQQGAIERLAGWLAGLSARDVPDAAVERAKWLLLDTLGCGLAALNDECAGAVLATLHGLGENPQCTVLGQPRRMSAPSAVLANGTLVRMLDLNDYVVGADPRSGARGGHPSDNIPVALAAAELAQASGRELLAAIVLGYEIYGRGKALMPADTSWDGTTVSGLAAPAMAGWLMRLPERQLAHAVALSAVRAPTPVGVREGAISAAKGLANALIAQNGMQATLLAARGITGPLDLFEAERGLGPVFTLGPAAEIFSAPLPEQSFIARTAIKAYPCFAGGQSAVAAAIALHRQLAGDVDRLAALRAVFADLPIVRRQLADAGRVDPQSREAADHSLQFLIAVTLIDGTFGLRQLEHERWRDAKVRALMARLETATDAELARRAGGAYPCALHAVDRDGRSYHVEVVIPPGFLPNGLDSQSVQEKFVRITADHLTSEQQRRIVAALTDLPSAPSCEALMRALQPSSIANGFHPAVSTG